jgi:anaphase-promoting complex subunit 10
MEVSTNIPSDDEPQDPTPFPPPGLKEISSLASWTVTTAKPGSGVAALRNPDLAHYWQSDGPQPHLLTLHFFKLVSISLIRIFLDFESDESYTPTKIQFLAGMGGHDVQEFAEMRDRSSKTRTKKMTVICTGRSIGARDRS